MVSLCHESHRAGRCPAPRHLSGSTGSGWISQHEHEKELLLNRNVKVRVLGFDKDSKTIEAEVLPPE